MEFLILFIPSILQLILIGFRLAHKITIPIGGITALMILLGIGLTILSVNLITNSLQGSNIRCGMPQAAAIMSGTFIAMVIVHIIGAISGLIWHFTNKPAQTNTAV